MNELELLSTIVLSRMNYFSLPELVELYRSVGSAKTILEHRRDIRELLPNATPRVVEAFKEVGPLWKRAETELAYDQANGIVAIALNDERYPQRLRECEDAPLVLFMKGNANLNPKRTIAVVGTRHCTTYGQDLIRHFCRDLSERCPGINIVSGLAYGIDVCAHTEALNNQLPTVGVLAHGLDDLYPPRHRSVAEKMVEQGALLTEYLTRTNADKMNFVRRNRIVAGMTDATVLVESGAKGGGLITCRIALDYNRSVFAFPGPVGATWSMGCNNLIRDNGAQLITSADDFVMAMGWEADSLLRQAQQAGIERQLFPTLSAEEQQVVDVLLKTNDLQMNTISVKCNIPIGQLTALLFNLEMKGVVKPYSGGTYHLLA